MFTTDEKRLLILAVGIVSLQSAITNGELHDSIIRRMEEKVDKSLAEYNSLILKVSSQDLVRKLEAL